MSEARAPGPEEARRRHPAKLVGKDRPGMSKVRKDHWPCFSFLLGLSVSILVKWEVCREISSIKMWLSDHFLGRMEDMEKKFEQSCKRLEALEAEKQELQDDVEVKHEVVVKSSEEIR